MVNLISTVLTPEYPTVYLVRTAIMEEAERRGGYFDGVVGQIPWTTDTAAADQHEYLCQIFIAETDQTFVRVIKEEHALSSTIDQRIDDDQWIDDDQADVIEFRNRYPSCFPLKDSDPAVVIPPCSRANGTTSTKYANDLSIIIWAGLSISLISLIIIGAMSGFQQGSQSTVFERFSTMSWLAAGIIISPISIYLRRCRGWKTNHHCPKCQAVAFYLLCFICAPAVCGLISAGHMFNEYGKCIRIY